MVDLEPFLEAPFEEASNLSFEALLLIGIGLLAAVAALGRSPVTMAVVAVYLCLIPGYVGFRARVWQRDDEPSDDEAAEADDESAADADRSDDPDDGCDDDSFEYDETDGESGRN